MTNAKAKMTRRAAFVFCFFVLVGATVAKECNTKKAAGSKLFCYYGEATPGVVDTCRCSHVVLPANSDADSIEKLRTKGSHAKLLLTVNEFNEALVNTLKTTKVDGLEINLKKLDSKSDIADFISTVRGKLGSDLYLALSVPAKTETLAKYYDFKALSKNVDVFVLQTHLLGVSRNVTFHPSRLSGVWDVQNTDSVVDLVSGLGAPLSKLAITAPVQAFKFELQNENHTAPGSPALELSTLTRDELCKVMDGDKWTLERDQDQAGPYVFRDKQWISFEDPTSMDIKAKYSRVRGLAGIALKDLSQDGGSECGQSLLEAVHEGLSKQSRAPRGAVLHSLEREILDAPASGLFQNVKVSPYRITRVIDVEGKVHAIRQDTRTEFECSRQGYFVHPRSCGRFYRCVKFDQQTDEFNVFEFDCPAGLVFDNRVEVCVWPGSLSDTSACSGSSEIAPVPKGRFACPGKAGYYADPENCRWFFACMDHGQEPFSAYEFRCPYGLVFDEDNLLCQWPWLVPKCSSGLLGVHGEEYRFGGLGLATFALDLYDGLGQLHGVKLGGLSGPLDNQIARTYSSFGGDEFGYNGTGLGFGSGVGYYSGSAGYQGGSGTGAGLQSEGHLGLGVGLVGGEYQAGSGLGSGGYQSAGFDGGSYGYTVGLGAGTVGGGLGTAQYQSGSEGLIGIGGESQIGSGGAGYGSGSYYNFQSGSSGNYGSEGGKGKIESTGSTGGVGLSGSYYQSGSSGNYDSAGATGYGGKGQIESTADIGGVGPGGSYYKYQSGSSGNYGSAGASGHGGKDQIVSIDNIGGLGLDGTYYNYKLGSSGSVGTSGRFQVGSNADYDLGIGSDELTGIYAKYNAGKYHLANSGLSGGVYRGTTVSPIYGAALGKSLDADKLLLQKVNIVAGGSSGVVPGVEILQHGVNLGSPSTTASSIPTVTSVPIPVASTTDFEVYRGGVVANIPNLQYKLESPGTINEHLSGYSNLSYVSSTPAPTSFGQQLYVSSTPSPTLQGQDLYVSSTPAPTLRGQNLYVSPTPGTTLHGQNGGYLSLTPTLHNQEFVSSTPSTLLHQDLVYLSAPNQLRQDLVVPSHDGSTGYHYQKPSVSFVEVPTSTIASVTREYLPSPTPKSNLTFVQATPQKTYVQPLKLQTYQFQKPVFYKKQRPAVAEGAAVSFQDIRKTVEVPLHYSKPVIQLTPTQSTVTYHAQQKVEVQPSVTLHQLTPTVEYQEGYHYKKPAIAFEEAKIAVQPAQQQGYHYQKPAVTFEEAKAAVTYQEVKHVAQPAVAYQEGGYRYEKPAVAFEETKVQVQPAVAYQEVKHVVQPAVAYQEVKQVVQPAVAYQEVKHEGYHYQKPTVKFEETKVAVQPTVIKHQVQPAVAYQEVNHVGYHYQKPSVAFEETKVAAQPTVAFQEGQHEVQPAVAYQEVKQVGYHYQKPAIAFEEGKVAVQPAVTYQEVTHEVKPSVTYQEVKPAVGYQEVQHIGYQYQKPAVQAKPAVAYQEVTHVVKPSVAYQKTEHVGYHYEKPAVAFEETKVAVQPNVEVGYQYQKPAVAFQEVKHEVQPAVAYQEVKHEGYHYQKPAIAFEETKVAVQPTVEVQQVGYQYQKPAVAFQEVKHEVQPSVAYQEVKHEGYHYEKPTVAFEETKVTAQPTVGYQEVKQVGYQHQKPAVTFTQTVQPAVTYQELTHKVQPAVAYQQVKHEGYHYQKPAVAFEETKVTAQPTVGYQEVKQVEYQYQKPAVTFTQTVQPAVTYQEVKHEVQPAVAYQEVKHEGYHYQKPAAAFEETKVTVQPTVGYQQVGYHYQKPAVQPAVAYHEVRHEVQPAVTYQEVKQEGYQYQKPAVAFEETKVAVQPTVGYQEVKQVGYQYQKPAVKFEETKVAVQPTVAYQEVKHTGYQYQQPAVAFKEVAQPAVTYQEVKYEGYHYQKPAVAFEEVKATVQPSVAYHEVTYQKPAVTFQEVKPAVQYQEVKQYQYQKLAVAVEKTKFTAQPAVTYQEIKHEFNREYYQKPAVSKVSVQPTVAYQEVKAAVQPSVAYQEVHQTGYQQPSVDIHESYHYQKPQVAFVEQRLQPTQPTLTYQFEQPAPTYKEVLLKQPRPAVVTYHKVKKPAVVFGERTQVVSTTPTYQEQDSGYQYAKPAVRFEDGQNANARFDFEEEVRNLEGQFESKPAVQTGYSYEKPAVAFEEEEVQEELIVPEKAFVTYKESRPISRYEFSSFDAQYNPSSTPKPTIKEYLPPSTTPATVYLPVKTNKEYLPPTVKTTKVYLPPARAPTVKTTKVYLPPARTTKVYIQTTTNEPPTREYLPVKTVKVPVKSTVEYYEATTEYQPVKVTKGYLPPVTVKTTKEYLPPRREYLPVRTTEEYLEPTTEYLPVKVTKEYLPSVSVTKEYLPPTREYLPVKTPSRRLKTTTPAYEEVTRRRKPERVYLPVATGESYRAADSRPGVKVTKSKSIIKVNDFHPILSAKLGAQCTCVSNTLTLRKKPKSLTVVEDEPPKKAVVVEEYKYQDDVVEPTIDDLEYVKSAVRPETRQEIVAELKEAVKEVVAEAFDRYGPGGTRGRAETLQGTVDCQRAGLFRHPKHCNKFYECRWDCYKKKFTLHVFNCPIHLTFDNTLGACNWPSQGPVCVDDTLLPSD